MLTEGLIVWATATLVVVLIVVPNLLHFRGRLRQDLERKQEAERLGLDRPVAQYPFVDPHHCIGCGSCVAACPEGDVLGIVGGTAVVVNGLRCVGHAHCEAACPVGAIQVGLGDLRSRSDVPQLDEFFQTSVPGIFVAGELGGLALVRNATRQGREAVEAIARRLNGDRGAGGGVHDLAIVGAGPSGVSASLSAAAAGLDYVCLEKEADLGGSLLHYPRRKMVLTQLVELPPWGSLDREEYQKEELLEIFEGIVRQVGLRIRFDEAVADVRRENGHFLLTSNREVVRARNVLLTLGRRGSPRKLEVTGEELPKVMYRLMDAESYRDQKILVVGGGDSAAEAAIGLCRQPGNQVTLSYRKEKLVRIKRKNQEIIEKLIEEGRIRPLFSSNVIRIEPGSVTLRVDPDRDVEIDNDYVFIFAGGVPPFGFLKKIGVQFGGAGH